MLLMLVSRLYPCLFLWILLGIMLILVALWSRLLHLLPSLRTQQRQQQRQQQGLRLDVVPAPGLIYKDNHSADNNSQYCFGSYYDDNYKNNNCYYFSHGGILIGNQRQLTSQLVICS